MITSPRSCRAEGAALQGWIISTKFKKESISTSAVPTIPLAARTLRKNEFCIVCNDGTRINCRSLFPGEVGRLACGAKGIGLCLDHTGRVDFGKCP